MNKPEVHVGEVVQCLPVREEVVAGPSLGDEEREHLLVGARASDDLGVQGRAREQAHHLVQVGAVPWGVSVVTTLGGSTSELVEAVALAEAGRIEPKMEKFPLEDVAEVYKKLEANEITGRAVLIP